MMDSFSVFGICLVGGFSWLFFCPVYVEVTVVSSLGFSFCGFILPQEHILKGRLFWGRSEEQ